MRPKSFWHQCNQKQQRAQKASLWDTVFNVPDFRIAYKLGSIMQVISEPLIHNSSYAIGLLLRQHLAHG